MLPIPFDSAPGDEAFQNRALRTEFSDGLKAAPFTVSRVRVEWNNGLPFQVVLAQKTLDRRRQLHPPGWKPEEHKIVLFDVVDLRLQTRQIARFILPGDLLYGRLIVGRIRSFQLERDYRAADLLVNELCNRLGVVRAR